MVLGEFSGAFESFHTLFCQFYFFFNPLYGMI